MKRRNPSQPIPKWLAKATSGIYPALIIAVFGALIYSNTFENSFHYDDERSIVTNRSIHDLSNLRAIWTFSPTRFIAYLSFALNYHFHGLELFGYHLVNLIVHIGSALLVWWLITLTLSTPAIANQPIAKHQKALALLGALVFVSHPLQTQAVTYIVQRTASLATLFYLASLSLYAKARLSRIGGKNPRVWFTLFGASVVAAILGMFTKENVFSLPLAILLYEFFFFRGERKLELRYAIPVAILLIAVPAVLILTDLLPLAETPKIPRAQYLLTEARVLVTYLRLLIVPVGQSLYYDFPLSESLLEIPTATSFLLLTAILSAGTWFFPKHRLLSFGAFWFFLTLAPESSIIPIRDVIYEHRLYLPMFGFSLIVASLYHYGSKWKGAGLASGFFFVVLASYAVLTYERNKVWADPVTLWSDVIEKSPKIVRAYMNRGEAYRQQGRYLDALSDFNRALQIQPRYGEALTNRGAVHFQMRDYEKAIADFDEALRLNPNLTKAYNSRGLAQGAMGDRESAIADLSEAIRRDSGFAEAFNNRGVIYRVEGQYDLAISDFNTAIRLFPSYAEAFNNRGMTYFKKKQYENAITDFDEAVRIDPAYGQAYLNRAYAHAAIREYQKAWFDAQRVQSLGLQVDPSFVETLRELLKR